MDDYLHESATLDVIVAGIVGNAATAAAAVPGPHEPTAAATAATATGVGLIADIAEQLARPNVGQEILNGAVNVVVDKATQKVPLLAPVLNEIGEATKSSALANQVIDKINTPSE